MRELAVFFCPSCGHYAYYQLSRRAVCPRCPSGQAMSVLPMHYAEFMRLGSRERDDCLSRAILKSAGGRERLTQLLGAADASGRELVAEMNTLIMKLDTENKLLCDTVKWMHDAIWEMLREKQEQALREAAAARVPEGRDAEEI